MIVAKPRRFFTSHDMGEIDRYYPLHGRTWSGWRTRLSRRYTPQQIASEASRLGVPHFGSMAGARKAWQWFQTHKQWKETK